MKTELQSKSAPKAHLLFARLEAVLTKCDLARKGNFGGKVNLLLGALPFKKKEDLVIILKMCGSKSHMKLSKYVDSTGDNKLFGETKKGQHTQCIEQIGSFDPLTNKYNEKLVSLNFERIKYWIGHGAIPSTPVAELLGLAGFFPVHPRTYMTAWRNRRANESREAVEQSPENIALSN
uniref:Small ribosomal subunit protein bS16m n=1 Tax=Timema cristinae TaxID=61476 RepID=A0A7R9GSU6_TIMCR|nr:unnamed protein product [Timema cristinae]